MNQVKIDIKELKCDASYFDKIRFESLKNKFLSREAIHSPWINHNNEVIAFHNSFFVLRELNVSPIIVVLQD